MLFDSDSCPDDADRPCDEKADAKREDRHQEGYNRHDDAAHDGRVEHAERSQQDGKDDGNTHALVGMNVNRRRAGSGLICLWRYGRCLARGIDRIGHE